MREGAKSYPKRASSIRQSRGGIPVRLPDVKPPFKNRPVPLRPERRRKVAATEVVYEPRDLLEGAAAQFLADVAANVEEEAYVAGTEPVVPAALEDNRLPWALPQFVGLGEPRLTLRDCKPRLPFFATTRFPTLSSGSDSSWLICQGPGSGSPQCTRFTGFSPLLILPCAQDLPIVGGSRERGVRRGCPYPPGSEWERQTHACRW